MCLGRSSPPYLPLSGARSSCSNPALSPPLPELPAKEKQLSVWFLHRQTQQFANMPSLNSPPESKPSHRQQLTTGWLDSWGPPGGSGNPEGRAPHWTLEPRFNRQCACVLLTQLHVPTAWLLWKRYKLLHSVPAADNNPPKYFHVQQPTKVTEMDKGSNPGSPKLAYYEKARIIQASGNGCKTHSFWGKVSLCGYVTMTEALPGSPSAAWTPRAHREQKESSLPLRGPVMPTLQAPTDSSEPTAITPVTFA